MNEWRYMLDTNMASDLIRHPTGNVAHRISRTGSTSCCVSAMTVSELRYGVAKRGSARLAELVEGLLSQFSIAPYEDRSTPFYANIRHELTQKGMLIGPVDLFIAAHAKSLGLTLVTDNVREFSRVDGLKIENWLEKGTTP